jgi:hypothetical protein
MDPYLQAAVEMVPTVEAVVHAWDQEQAAAVLVAAVVEEQAVP